MRSTTVFSLLMACLLVSSLVPHSEGRGFKKFVKKVKDQLTNPVIQELIAAVNQGKPCQVKTEHMNKHVEARIHCPGLNVRASGRTKAIAVERASEAFVHQALQRNIIKKSQIENWIKSKDE